MIRESLYLYTITNSEKVLFPTAQEPAFLDEWEYTANRMSSAPIITGTVMHRMCLDDMWDNNNVFVEFNGERYYVRQVPTSSKDTNDVRYKHEINLLSERAILENVLFMDVVTPNTEEQYKDRFRSNNTTFSFYGTLHEFVSRINDSLIYVGIYDVDTNEGYHVVIDEGISIEETLELSFSNIYISSALQEGYNKFKIPYYWVGKTCHFGYTENSILKPFEYGQSNGLLSITKENANNRIINRITGIGSSDNIPFYYPNEDQYGEAVFSTENIDKSLVSVSLKDVASYNPDMYGTYTYCINKDETFEDISNFEDVIISKTRGGSSYFNFEEETHIYATFIKSYHTHDNNGFLNYNTNFSLSHFYLEFKIYGKKGSCIDITDFFHPLYKLPNNHDIKVEILRELNVWAEIYSPVLDWIVIDRTYFFVSDEEYTLRIHYQDLKFIITSRLQPFSYAEVIFYNWFDCNIMYFLKNQIHDFFIYGKDNENQIEYNKSGITIGDKVNASHAVSVYKYKKGKGFIDSIEQSSLENATKVIVTDRKYITPSANLVPPIYRESFGGERFYNAENDTYTDENGDNYVFKNTYSTSNPMEGVITFNDIKPTIKGIKNEAGQLIGEIAGIAYDSDDSDETEENSDENSQYIHSYFYIKLHIFNGAYGFNLFKQALEKGAMTFNFTSGNCAGCEFEVGVSEPRQVGDHYEFDNPVQVDENGNIVAGNYNDKVKFENIQPCQQDTSTNEVWIALKKEESTYGVVMPNARNNYKPNIGDTFVITNILMPRIYIINAENELKSAIVKYMSENNEEKFNFNISLSRIYLHENPDIAQLLDENSRIVVRYNEHDYTLYVSSYTCKVTNDLLVEISVSLTEELMVSDSVLNEKISDITQGLFAKSYLDIAIQGQNLFLSKLQDDVAKGKIAFANLIKALSGIQIGDEGIGGYIDKDGNAELGNVYLRGLLTLITGLQSQYFKSGYSGQGLQILSKDSNGHSYIEVDKLYVRMKAIFEQLEIREIQYIGGNFIFSPASGKISSVVETDEFYICYFNNDDGETKVDIQFEEGDLVLCKSSNISEIGNYEGVSNRYYWRRCMAVSYEDGNIYLSKEYLDKSIENDAPKAGDNVVTLGNDIDTSRQNAIIISVVGDTADNFNINAPSIIQYAGINDFSIIGKSVTKISPNGNEFTGSFKVVMSDGSETGLSSWMEAESDRISLSVGDSIKNGINGITINTRNLVSHGNVGVTNVTTYKVMDVILTSDMIEGQKYTFVMKATPTNEALKRKYTLIHPAGFGLGGGFTMPEEGITSYTFTYSQNGHTDYATNIFSIYHYPNSSDLENNPVSIYWICLYEGDGKVPMIFVPNIDDTENKVTENTASIKILSDSIEQRVTKTEFNALAIGGRNLVIGATNGNGLKGVGTYDIGTGVFTLKNEETTNNSDFSLGKNIVLEKGQNYTLSFEVRGQNVRQSGVFILETGGSPVYYSNPTVWGGTSTDWSKMVFTFKVEYANTETAYLLFRNYFVTSGTSLMEIRHIKLEKGDKATDFSPAPEDVKTYTETIVKQTAEAWSVKLHQSTLTDNLLHNSSMLKNIQAVTVNGITNATPEHWIIRRTENSSMVVSEGTGNLTGIYFENAQNFEGMYQSTTENLNLAGLKEGDVLTISFDLFRPDESLTRLCVWTEEHGYTGLKVDELAPVGSWTRLKLTYTYSASTMKNFVVFNVSDTNVAVSFAIRNIKLEYGDFATEWCGSIEDAERDRNADLLATGIDVENRKISVTADQFLVQNNRGVQTAVFDGRGDKPLLKADNIDVDNLKVKHLDGADGVFKGELSIGSEQKIKIYESTELPKSVRISFLDSSDDEVAYIAYNGKDFYFVVYQNSEGAALTISSDEGLRTPSLFLGGKKLVIGEDNIVRAE